jgi:glyoxylase-like metal-dependent hydrolase (beta-lactamase superfamily II)
MQIGKYEVHLIDAGKYRLDGGAMFGVVPRTLWEKENPPDDKNRILLALNTLLLIRDGQVILVDSGIGEKFDEKYQKIFAVDYSEHSLSTSLAEKNVQPEDVTDVIITHLHFDHVGGTTYYDDGRNLKLQFPNANHYLQKNQLEWALKRFPKDRASYLTENIEPLMQSRNLKVIDGPQKLFEGIDLKLSDGHTVAQQLVLISGESEKLIYTADLVPTVAHIPIPWVMAYDLFPVKTIEEKHDLLKMASDEEWLILFEHEPWEYCGLVDRGNRGFKLKETVKL